MCTPAAYIEVKLKNAGAKAPLTTGKAAVVPKLLLTCT
jgi:hypothetical protein